MKRKQFRLIKTYPGSAPLNTVYEELYGMKNKSYRRVGGDNKYIDESLILNNPEFWEEIKEPYYQILSFSYEKWGNKLAKLKKDGKYNLDKSFWDLKDLLETGVSVKSGDIKINSIKRLSDGQIFTIGDRVTYNSHFTPLTINKFKLENDRIFIEYKERKDKWFDDWIYDNVKIIKSIFTTYDNVEIFENDYYWYVNNNKTKIEQCVASTNVVSDFGKCFSTKERAKEYILHHKPLFTLKDVIHQDFITKEKRNEFYKLAKKRLNETI